jgi:hypothetical protein
MYLEMRNENESEGKRPLGRPKSRWKDNIQMDLKDIIWEDVDWSHLAQNRVHWQAVVSTVMNVLSIVKRREMLRLFERLPASQESASLLALTLYSVAQENYFQ